jgi:hypothetical protein
MPPALLIETLNQFAMMADEKYGLLLSELVHSFFKDLEQQNLETLVSVGLDRDIIIGQYNTINSAEGEKKIEVKQELNQNDQELRTQGIYLINSPSEPISEIISFSEPISTVKEAAQNIDSSHSPEIISEPLNAIETSSLKQAQGSETSGISSSPKESIDTVSLSGISSVIPFIKETAQLLPPSPFIKSLTQSDAMTEVSANENTSLHLMFSNIAPDPPLTEPQSPSLNLLDKNGGTDIPPQITEAHSTDKMGLISPTDQKLASQDPVLIKNPEEQKPEVKPEINRTLVPPTPVHDIELRPPVSDGPRPAPEINPNPIIPDRDLKPPESWPISPPRLLDPDPPIRLPIDRPPPPPTPGNPSIRPKYDFDSVVSPPAVPSPPQPDFVPDTERIRKEMENLPKVDPTSLTGKCPFGYGSPPPPASPPTGNGGANDNPSGPPPQNPKKADKRGPAPKFED